jgi:hypothetical protein
VRRRTSHVVRLARLLGAASHLEAVTIRIEEIDRLAEAMILRAKHIVASCQQAAIALWQRFHAGHIKGEMLHPPRRVRVTLLGRRGSGVEKGKVTVVAEFKENKERFAGFALGLASRRREHRGGIFEADHLAVKIDRFLRVAAAICDVVQLLEHGRHTPVPLLRGCSHI